MQEGVIKLSSMVLASLMRSSLGWESAGHLVLSWQNTMGLTFLTPTQIEAFFINVSKALIFLSIMLVHPKQPDLIATVICITMNKHSE